MASEVDICNLALARLGDEATVSSIDPPEGSAQAEHCQRFYPIARDTMLESHDWGFATKRQTLARLSGATSFGSFMYVVPSNAVRIIDVRDGGKQVDYNVEATTSGEKVIYCKSEEITIQYIERVRDTTRYSPLFVDALGWLLASHLAGPVLKGAEGMRMAQQCLTAYNTIAAKARVSDSNQQRVDTLHIPDWVRARS